MSSISKRKVAWALVSHGPGNKAFKIIISAIAERTKHLAVVAWLGYVAQMTP
jgi:hypothetical protein